MERGGRVNEGGEFNGFLTADYFFYKFLSVMFLELWNLDSRVCDCRQGRRTFTVEPEPPCL